MSKLPIFDHFLSVGNLKPRLKPFFKPKLKPECFLLNRLPPRIVGGEVVEPHSIPFQVLVKFGNYVGCGGSIYDNMTIITAAHCCQGQTINSIKVR